MVDVGFLHRSITAGPLARQITPPNELQRRGRRPIPPGSGVAPVGTVTGLRVAVVARAHRLGGQDPEPGHARTSRIEVHLQIHPVAQLRPGQPHPRLGVMGDRIIELG